VTHKVLFRLLQNKRCPYCGNRLGKKGTWDHVHPKCKGHTREGNKLLVHLNCNRKKADRAPHPCEVLYLDGINHMLEYII